MPRIRSAALVPLALVAALACLGAGAPAATPTPAPGAAAASPGHAQPAPALTGSAWLGCPTPAGAAAGTAACPEPTAALAAEGRKVFVGGGNCATCHGADAKGTPLAPNLVSHKWINIDGSYAAIAELVTAGVPHPKQHPAPMPAMGGAQLTPDQVKAVAAYEWSLSHPQGGK